MKHLLLLVFVFAMFVSCASIYFEEPQPRGINDLKSIPKDLQGKYSYIIIADESQIEIGPNFIETEDGKSYLSDSLIIRKFNDHYIVSKKSDVKNYWGVIVLKDDDCGNLEASIFMISSDMEESGALDEIKTTYRAIEFEKNNGNGKEKGLVINPTQEEFRKLMDSKLKMDFLLESMTDNE